jgi:hypothetical protein
MTCPSAHAAFSAGLSSRPVVNLSPEPVQPFHPFPSACGYVPASNPPHEDTDLRPDHPPAPDLFHRGQPFETAMSEHDHVGVRGLQDCQCSARTRGEDTAKTGGHFANDSSFTRRLPHIPQPLLLRVPGPLGEDEDSFVRLEIAGEELESLHLARRAGVAIDEVVRESVAADVEGGVDQELTFHHIAEPDAGRVGHESRREHGVHHRGVAAQQHDGPRCRRLLTLDFDVEGEDPAEGGEVPGGPGDLESERCDLLYTSGKRNGDEQADEGPHLTEQIDPEEGQGAEGHPGLGGGDRSNQVDRRPGDGPEGKQDGEKGKEDQDRGDCDQSSGQSIVRHEEDVTLSSAPMLSRMPGSRATRIALAGRPY